ncbi:helix-turn-helix domain-containing protein [Saccharopolyspora gregorii]|uniref:helix-turn-helix domain-containing protein n=1 Tax=Saccharopolyspora gregorii TaxID=33914 RepID=UPI0021AC1460|nr:helix-turn-helix domain-containing protein [Saccharopolyspora gregorii]
MSDNKDTHSDTPISTHLYTPKEAADLLTIKESWLRRKAGNRTIPCTFLGKHLRFSEHDLRSIINQGETTPPTRRGRPRRSHT